jgi:hypothetical protein
MDWEKNNGGTQTMSELDLIWLGLIFGLGCYIFGYLDGRRRL